MLHRTKRIISLPRTIITVRIVYERLNKRWLTIRNSLHISQNIIVYLEVEWLFDQLLNRNTTSLAGMQLCDQIARETPRKIELPYLVFPELSSSNELTTTQH